VSAAPAPGEIVLEHASRSFAVSSGGRSLRDSLFGRFRQGRALPLPVRALDDVSLRVRTGETIGLVGRNGAGKTSTLRVLAGIVPLQSGRAECGGRVATLLELGAGFGREFSGRENAYLNGALHGLGRAEVEARLDDIVEFSELGSFIDAPVKTYSSGMLVRLGFSIAAHLDADVLLIDEVLAVGDEAFQRKCMARIAERIAAGATLVFVSHSAAAVERVCERVAVLDHGRLAFDGPTAEGLLHYHRMLGTEHGEGHASRPGGAAARRLAIEDVELQDGEGRRRNVFACGEPLRLCVTVVAHEKIGDPALQFELRDGGGRPVFGTTTAIALDGEGRASLRFDVERLALLGGDYDLVLGAGERGHTVFDRILGLSVADVPGAAGVVDMRGTWTATEPVRAAS